MNETRPELRRILNEADATLRNLISHLDRVLSTPTQSWTFESRKQAMKGLSAVAYGAMEKFGMWMEQNVWIKNIVEIHGALECVRTNAWHAAIGESRVWGRTYLRQNLEKLIKLFGDGCELEMEIIGVETKSSVPALKYQLTQSNSKPAEYLSVGEVAQFLGISRSTVTKRFAHYPGVLDLTAEDTRKNRIRQHRLLRIPRSVLNRFIHDNRVR